MAKRAHATPVMSAVPPSDHIDVFLDAMKMDHELDFRDRLEINTYAVDPADIFLSKLQIVNLSEKDAHDVITLCKDVYVDFHPHPGVLDLEHVAETCAADWGLYIDVMSNIDKVLERLDDYDLSPMETSRIARTLELAQDMMTEHSKSLRWRMRARVGKRLRWYNEVDETFGGRTRGDGRRGAHQGGPGDAQAAAGDGDAGGLAGGLGRLTRISGLHPTPWPLGPRDGGHTRGVPAAGDGGPREGGAMECIEILKREHQMVRLVIAAARRDLRARGRGARRRACRGRTAARLLPLLHQLLPRPQGGGPPLHRCSTAAAWPGTATRCATSSRSTRRCAWSSIPPATG